MKKRISLFLCVAVAALSGCSDDSVFQDQCLDEAGCSSVSQAFLPRNFGVIGGLPWDVRHTIAPGAPTSDFGHGRSIALGDINGDGNIDLVVGETALTSRGKVNVYWGRNGAFSPDSMLELTSGYTSVDAFGMTVLTGKFCDVAGARGDLVLVAAPGVNNYTGAIMGYYFNVRMLKFKQLNGPKAFEMVGAKMAVGDVNGDGKSDLVYVATPLDPATGEWGLPYVGVVLDFCARADGGIAPDLVYHGSDSEKDFGSALYLADVDNLGKDQIIVVESLYSTHDLVPDGAVHFLHVEGGAIVPSRPMLVGDKGSIGSVGFLDINGDGLLDIVVGEPMYQTSRKREGRVLVYENPGKGLPFDVSAPRFTVYSDRSHARFGSSVLVQDITGDGVPDLVVGAPGWRDDGMDRAQGYVYVFLGTKDGSVFSDRPYWTYISNVATSLNDDFGRTLAVGDVDKKGWLDIVVGSPGASTSAALRDHGRVDLFLSSTTPCYRAEGCLMDEVCYKAGEASEASRCLVCDPTRANFEWSDLVCGDIAIPCRVANACQPDTGCSYSPAPDGTSCGTVSCSANALTHSMCQSGACETSVIDCGFYSCSPELLSCMASCSSDLDCYIGVCTAEGQCAIPNVPPVIVLDYPSSVKHLEFVTIDASASYDPDSDPITFKWTVLVGDILLDTETVGMASFVAPEADGYVRVLLAVSDDKGNEATETINIAVSDSGNHLPVIVLNGRYQVWAGHSVTLDASLTTDPDGDPLAFAWSSATADTALLSTLTESKTVFTAPNDAEVGAEFGYKLTVSDGHFSVDADTVIEIVSSDTLPAPVVTWPLNQSTVLSPLLIQGTALVDADVTVRTQSRLLLCSAAVKSGHWQCTANLSPGVHVLEALLVDETRMSDPSLPVTVTVSDVPSYIPVITQPKNNAVVGTRPAISGTVAAQDGTVSVWSVDGDSLTLLCTASVGIASTWTCVPGTPLEHDTRYTIQADWRNQSNESDMSAAVTFVVDAAIVSSLSFMSPVDGAQLESHLPVIFAGKSDPGAVVSVILEGGDIVCATITNGLGFWYCSDVWLSVGQYTATATAEFEGNMSTVSVAFEVIEACPNCNNDGGFGVRGGSCSAAKTQGGGAWWMAGFGLFFGLAMMRRRKAVKATS
ncbi:MAG: FG-GAP-like repeat-containing protein [Proteobacteria bacterium]|nr:FG-GAP-like repeat-containing protein [Pseudomonadota bacterium]